MIERRLRVELSEYEQIRVDGVVMSEADGALAERLSGDEQNPRITVRWLATGQVEINATQWVGVVTFSELEIHVVPKFLGGSLQVLKMLDFVSSSSLMRSLENERVMELDGLSLPDMLCRLLADSAHRLLDRGLLHGYRSVEDELPVLRGRLDHRTQVLRRFGRIDQLQCIYDEYDADHPDNQLVCAALGQARTMATDRRLKRDLARLHGLYAEACSPLTSEPDWYRERIVYGRLNERYRTCHDIAYLVLRNSAFDDLFSTEGSLNIQSFMLNMNVLFERFVRRLVDVALSGTGLWLESHTTLRAAIVDSSTQRSYSTIDPDLIVGSTRDDRRIPIDIKYKRYDDHQLSTSDIYQAVTYGLALSAGSEPAHAGILYPGAQTMTASRLDVKGADRSHRVHINVISLNLASVLNDIDSSHQLTPELATELRRLIGSMRPADQRVTASA